LSYLSGRTSASAVLRVGFSLGSQEQSAEPFGEKWHARVERSTRVRLAPTNPTSASRFRGRSGGLSPIARDPKLGPHRSWLPVIKSLEGPSNENKLRAWAVALAHSAHLGSRAGR
jgi:hypothetical protein